MGCLGFGGIFLDSGRLAGYRYGRNSFEGKGRLRKRQGAHGTDALAGEPCEGGFCEAEGRANSLRSLGYSRQPCCASWLALGRWGVNQSGQLLYEFPSSLNVRMGVIERGGATEVSHVRLGVQIRHPQRLHETYMRMAKFVPRYSETEKLGDRTEEVAAPSTPQ